MATELHTITTIRLPAELLKRGRIAAMQDEKRSFNAYLIELLREDLKRRDSNGRRKGGK